MVNGAGQGWDVAGLHAFRRDPGQTSPLGEARAPLSLEGLRGSGLADRFCAWAGGSGRRCIFSVMRLADEACIENLPLGAGAVVLAVRRQAGVPRRVIWAAVTAGDGPGPVLRAALRQLAAEPHAEVHLHLLATDAGERAAILADLGFPLLPPSRPLSAARHG